MRYRLAKSIDLNEIVNIHYSIRDSYKIGIFAELDKSFLRQYYKIVLNDKNEIVVCAEDKFGKIHGFCSASLDVNSLITNIQGQKFKLGLSALKSVLLKPKLLKSLYVRYKSIKTKTNNTFITSTGARLEYWAWSKKQDSFSSIEMHEKLLNILEILGVKILSFEVDTLNKNIYKFHKSNGAELIDKIILSDGRERALMKYNLENRLRNKY